MQNDKYANRLIAATDTMKELMTYYTIIILLASMTFMYFEHLVFADSVWLALVTATSTGYGDFYPKTGGGRVAAVSLMLTTQMAIIPLITARLAARLTVDNDVFSHAEQEAMKQGQEDIRALLTEVRGYIADRKENDPLPE